MYKHYCSRASHSGTLVHIFIVCLSLRTIRFLQLEKEENAVFEQYLLENGYEVQSDDLQSDEYAGYSEEELIDIVTKEILKKHKTAFEELAK